LLTGPKRTDYIQPAKEGRKEGSKVLSDSHGESASHGKETSHEAHGKGKSSSKRLLLTTVIMVGFAALTWGPSLLSRNVQAMFIPAWLTLTVGTVVISMWFGKYILTAEKYRDSETVPQAPSGHSH
jgi:hypothetical protein